MNSTREQLELNRLCLWQKVPAKSISKRVYTANRTYVENGVLNVASFERPVSRYVKSFKKHNKEFSMFIFSDEQDEAKIDKFFSDALKKITKESVLETVMGSSDGTFKYTDLVYKGNK